VSYLVFEGPDFAGKTTVLTEMAKRLVDKGGSTLLSTKEPGTPHVEGCPELRSMLINKVISTEFQFKSLFALDFHLHCDFLEKQREEVSDLIILQDRTTAISDRAYRNPELLPDTHKKAFEAMQALELYRFASLNPIVFFIDVDDDTVVERMKMRKEGEGLNQFEIENFIPNAKKINERYRRYNNPSYIKSILQGVNTYCHTWWVCMALFLESQDFNDPERAQGIAKAYAEYLEHDDKDRNMITFIRVDNNGDMEETFNNCWKFVDLAASGKFGDFLLGKVSKEE